MSARPADQSLRIGVMLPNWVGDVVMATPAIRAIRHKFGPQATYIGVMKPQMADVLNGLSWFDESLFFDARSKVRRQRVSHVARQLYVRRLDWMFLLPNSLRAGLIAWLAGARRRVGYDRYGRGMLLTDKLLPPRRIAKLEPISAVDYFLQLVYAVGCPIESPHLDLATIPQDERHADKIWEQFRFGQAKGVVIFNTGGAYGPAKNWPPEYFAELAQRISSMGWSVLVVCGPSERSQANEIVWRAKCPNVHSLAKENVSIGLTKACIRRGDLLLTTDSGPRHFAVAFRIPSIVLFGPTDPRWSENYRRNEIQLSHKISCSPCGQRECPQLHHRCMRELQVDHVFAAVEQQLKKSLKGPAA